MTQPTLLGVVDEEGFVWTRPRQLFVQLYVATDGDAKNAARDAKLPPEDDPEELLEIPSVRRAIEALHDQVFRRALETRDSVLSRLANIAEGNLVDYFDFETAQAGGRERLVGMRPKDLRKFPIHMQKRVKKMKLSYTANGDSNWEIELHDAMAATKELARILGLGEQGEETPQEFAEAIHNLLTETDFEYQGKPKG